MPRLLLPIVLVVSIAANAFLFTRWRSADEARLAAAAQASRPPLVPAIAPAIPATRPADAAAVPTTPAEFAALRSQLESLGIPPEVARMALGVLLHRDFQRQRGALLHTSNPNEYWRNPQPRPGAGEQAAIRDLEREHRKRMRDLVGDDSFDDDPNSQVRQYGNLAPDKITRLKKIFADYNDLEEQLFSDGVDRGSADSRARAALLAREKRADIERLLTPEELQGYDLRNSQAAQRLRGRLGNFAATESEFLALYPTFKAVIDENADTHRASRANVNEQRQAREAAERRLEAEMLRILGEARFGEWKDANDHLLQETRAFTTSLNLPSTTTAEVIAIQREFSPRLQAVDRDRDLTPNQRDAQASALGIEARDRLIRLLGPEHFETYKRRGGGWLGAALNRRAPTPSPNP